MKCPRCGAGPELIEPVTDDPSDLRVICDGCASVWKLEQEPRLIEPTERVRRDLD